MKSRVFLVLLAVVVVVHGILFFLPGLFRSDDPTPPPVAGPEDPAPENASRARPIAPAADQHSETTTGGADAEPTAPDSRGDAVEQAVGLVKRADASTPRTPPSDTIAPTVDRSETEEPIELGVVEGNSKLSPEIRELAREGAEAVASQKWKRARDIYLEMVSTVPDNALAFANLGVAEYQLGNLIAASGNLRKSLNLNPSIAQNWQTLGLIHYKRGELEMAISALTRAIHEDPSEARSRLYLAAVVRDYGWLDAAVTELERAVETDPELADAHYNLAVTYLDQDPPRIELARRHYFSAVDLGAQPSPEIESAFANGSDSE